MNPTGKNVLAFVAAAVVTMAVNGGLIGLGFKVVGMPPGVDPNKPETFKANSHLFETKHFAVPFLAHALGSVAGGFVVSMIAASHRFQLAMGIGVLHLAGGIYAATIIPAPGWFIALDLIAAYLPSAWLGHKIATSVRPMTPVA
jgi:hypothetical protein